MVLGADGQRVLQEAQGQVVLHHAVEHQADVVLQRGGRSERRVHTTPLCRVTPGPGGRSGGRAAAALPAGRAAAHGRSRFCPRELRSNGQTREGRTLRFMQGQHEQSPGVSQGLETLQDYSHLRVPFLGDPPQIPTA